MEQVTVEVMVVLAPSNQSKSMNRLELMQEKIAALRDIQRQLDAKVSGYKKLRGGVFEVTELPRTSTGKFMRKQLGRHSTRISTFDNDVRASKL